MWKEVWVVRVGGDGTMGNSDHGTTYMREGWRRSGIQIQRRWGAPDQEGSVLFESQLPHKIVDFIS
jgi:hypothetical protein